MIWRRARKSSERSRDSRQPGIRVDAQGKPLADCVRRVAGRIHGGAGYQHRQRRTAAHRRQSGCEQRRKHLGADLLSGLERDRSPHHRMAGLARGAQALLPYLHLSVHGQLALLRRGAHLAHPAAGARDSGHRRRRPAAHGPGHPCRHLSSEEARARLLRLWSDRGRRASDRPYSGWLGHRQL